MPGHIIYHEIRNTVNKAYRDNVIMNKSNHAYALNNQITALFNYESWLGKRCFIIGGGPSLKGFDFSRLDSELTIGINKTFKYYPRSTINYCMDSVFYGMMQKGDYNLLGESPLMEFWNSYRGTRVFLTPMELKTFGKEVYVVRKELTPSLNRLDLDKGIYGGNNSGTGAITLAVALGASQIYLLGYDMKAENTTHWHEGYEKRNLEDFNVKLKTYRDDITKLVPMLTTSGIKVVNLNRNSELTCFQFDDFDNVIGGKSANV